MHEIGVIMEVVKMVERFAAENQVEQIETLVLQIGELSSMVPKYIENLYPAAIEETILEGSRLEIEILPANGLCKECNQVFPVVLHQGVCPTCECNHWEMLSGKEFYIKEILCC